MEKIFLYFDLRDGVVERDHGAGDHSDVHHVPVVTHVRPGVEDEAAVQDLRNIRFLVLPTAEALLYDLPSNKPHRRRL